MSLADYVGYTAQEDIGANLTIYKKFGCVARATRVEEAKTT